VLPLVSHFEYIHHVPAALMFKKNGQTEETDGRQTVCFKVKLFSPLSKLAGRAIA